MHICTVSIFTQHQESGIFRNLLPKLFTLHDDLLQIKIYEFAVNAMNIAKQVILREYYATNVFTVQAVFLLPVQRKACLQLISTIHMDLEIRIGHIYIKNHTRSGFKMVVLLFSREH